MYSSVRALITATSLVLPPAASATCWDEARRSHGIDPSLLEAIAWREPRGWTDTVGPKLKDGNRALDLIQISTIRLPNLARLGIRREHLFGACTSQKVGAWALADYIQRFSVTWKSVGCYYADPASTNVGAQIKYVRDAQWFYEGYRKQQAHQVSTSPAQVASFQED